MGNAVTSLTSEALRAAYCYDAASGNFYRISAARGARPGRIVGNIDSGGYVRFEVHGAQYRAHRLAVLYVAGRWPAALVDHINGIRSDNRWVNLREADIKLNAENTKRARANNLSCGFLGVTRRGPSFVAQIKADGAYRYLGSFTSGEAAHDAYLVAKRQLHAGCTI